MLLEFDADQRLWQDTVRDAVGKQCPPSLVREVAENGVDPSPLWQAYIDAGWTELTDPENAVELAIVLEELGRATDPTPFLATLTQFAPLVGDRFDPQKAGAAIYDGVTAYRDADGWVLDGTARHVLDADRAERLAVVTDGGVFLVDAGRGRPSGAARCSTRCCTSPTCRSPASGCPTPSGCTPMPRRPVISHSPAWRSPRSARASAFSTWCSSTSSSASSSASPIGSFQAVQHKAVDMHVATERARALSYFAALTISADDPRRRLAAAMAKAAAGECQAVVFRHGLQLFGAMGFTWENDLQFALKRAKAGELLLGGAAEHRAMIAEEFNAADF